MDYRACKLESSTGSGCKGGCLQGGGMENVTEWPHSECILCVKQMGLADGLDVGDFGKESKSRMTPRLSA